MINAFTTDIDLKKAVRGGATKIVVTAENADFIGDGENVIFYQRFSDKEKLNCDKVFLPSLLLEDDKIDFIIDYILGKRAKFMVAASMTLEEVGLFDARYKLSPIMLLHKLGLLTNAIIVGGVYLDNDDVDLIVQENARLVLTPSYNAGNGHGIANIASCLKRGLKINLGTADNKYNADASLEFEARLVRLFSNATMHSSQSISDDDIFNMLYKF